MVPQNHHHTQPKPKVKSTKEKFVSLSHPLEKKAHSDYKNQNAPSVGQLSYNQLPNN
jgi:hypothetical protein